MSRRRASTAVRCTVWDLPTRLFHWSLVGLVCVAVATKLAEPEWWLPVHLWAGYGITALLAFRFVWAVFGSHYSRLASFAPRPREVIDYLRGVMLLRPAHHMGHNPAGAVMIGVLVLVLVGLVVTGLMVAGGEEKLGPLAGVVGYAVADDARALHRALVWTLIAMVAVHIAGVLVTSVLHRENLVRAMVTGWKTLPAGTPLPAPRAARPLAAALAMAAVTGVAAAVLVAVPQLAPAPVRALAWDASYVEECGACHEVYHPSLLPAASWRALARGLSDHFGEDASLDPGAARHIGEWLAGNAAGSWDTEAANRFRHVDPAAPLRITATPYWRRKHAEIAPAVFARDGVRGKGNCASCHRDARSGRFDDRAIRIPEE